MRTAAAYIRVSTDMQTEYSPDSQLKVIRDYAEKNDILLLENHIYMEDGGISGKSMKNRTEFLRLIGTAQKKPKPFDIILLWKFSRFSRNQEESIVVKSMLKKSGIDVISISEALPEGPFGELMERILEWQDSYYLVNLSQEVKRGMKEKASRGEPVVAPPIGYTMKDGQYIPDDNAAIVQNIFADYVSGMGLRAIATKYAALGFRTTRGNPPDNRYIEYILRNPVYISKIRWTENGRTVSRRDYDNPNTLIFDGKHQPIIDTDIFNKVQEMLNEQKLKYGKYQRREQPVGYMLKGLVRCDNCDATLVLINTQSPSMQCHRYARGQCNVSHSITVNKANAAVIDYIKSAAMSGDFTVNKKTETAAAPELDLNKLLENENMRLERAKQAYQAGVDSLEEYKLAKAKITDKIKHIKSQIAATDKKVDKKAFKKKLMNVLKIIEDPSQNESTKNSALRTVVEKIVFNKKQNRFEIFFYE